MESEVGLVKVDRINPKFTIAIITKEEDGIRKEILSANKVVYFANRVSL